MPFSTAVNNGALTQFDCQQPDRRPASSRKKRGTWPKLTDGGKAQDTLIRRGASAEHPLKLCPNPLLALFDACCAKHGNMPARLTIDVVGPMPIVILIASFSH
jgi:hypothetical protein